MDNELHSDLERDCEQTSQSASHTSTNNWQRISPIALIYFVLKLVKGIFGNFIYLAPALYLSYDKVAENPSFWLPIIYGFIALIVLSAVLSFYFFQYRLSNQQIEIRSGVFSKKYINLPFSRIQNVELTEPLYYRPFGYTCMQLDTAGSIKQEAKVVAINKRKALQLKDEILAAHKPENVTTNTEQDSPEQSEDEVVLDTRNLDDLVIHGITNNRVWIFIAGLAPFIDQISDKIGQWLYLFGFNVEQYFEFEGKSGWQIATTAISLTLMVMIPITIFSIIGSIIAFHDFKLSKSGDRYIRRSGLFTRNEVTMRLSRLQVIVRQQDWLDVLLGRINLKFEQSNANFQQTQPGQLTNKIIVPSVTRKECQFLIDDAYPENQLADIQFKRVSPRLLVRNLFIFVMPITAIITSFVYVDQPVDMIIYVLVFALFISALITMSYLRKGYAVDDNFIYVRKGCLGVDYYCFPIYKVQQTSFKQSWFLKQRQLCSIEFVLASGAIAIPYLSEKIGLSLINNSLQQVEQSKKNWM
ncbi:PH domain-containing protein [Thalassomonas sp. M1454]|uniref:PH domain-containing protein n=1 Tax=Thalassomonas sp. M1454 TaxID=2594477 RepID=UPI00117C4643|nr:PH domain-containing protein [Thalassomonas sp. M1454]TRX58077.1 PH domain-containing protein [Thalassomonas sp. M1454]